MAKPDGTFEVRPWAEELRRLVYEAPTTDLEGFVMTVGVASNHGNWFTSGDPNKELRVLAQSYDWLLFLTDDGIAEFVHHLLLDRARIPNPVGDAFLRSYQDSARGNVFTKVKISRDANITLLEFFERNLKRIENEWFKILSPKGEEISTLKMNSTGSYKEIGHETSAIYRPFRRCWGLVPWTATRRVGSCGAL